MKFFSEKISFERRVINVVNGYYTDARQLAGLSQLALREWEERNRGEVSPALSQALSKLSKMSSSLTDFSGHVVESDDVVVFGFDEEVKNLEELLSKSVFKLR